MKTTGRMTGGCQCGAVRFRVEGVGRAAICHCRMCQKAFGNAFAPLVTAKGLVWTKAEPKRFQSSDKVKRGFCADCGTPLTYEFEGHETELAVGAFDNPAAIEPALQVALQSRIPWVEHLAELPTRSSEEAATVEPVFAALTSYQHPDHEAGE